MVARTTDPHEAVPDDELSVHGAGVTRGDDAGAMLEAGVRATLVGGWVAFLRNSVERQHVMRQHSDAVQTYVRVNMQRAMREWRMQDRQIRMTEAAERGVCERRSHWALMRGLRAWQARVREQHERRSKLDAVVARRQSLVATGGRSRYVRARAETGRADIDALQSRVAELERASADRTRATERQLEQHAMQLEGRIAAWSLKHATGEDALRKRAIAELRSEVESRLDALEAPTKQAVTDVQLAVDAVTKRTEAAIRGMARQIEAVQRKMVVTDSELPSRSRSTSRSRSASRSRPASRMDIEEIERHARSAEALSPDDARGGRVRVSYSAGRKRDDDEESLMSMRSSVVSHKAEGYGLVDLKAKEIERFQCDMTQRQIDERLTDFAEDVRLRSPLLAELLDMGGDEYVTAMGERRDLALADAWLCRQCQQLVKMGGDEASNFRSEERRVREEDSESYRSGRATLERMLDHKALKTPAQIEKHEEMIKSKVYLHASGMSEAQVIKACNDLREDWMRLPSYKRSVDKHAVHRLLISKIPKSISESAGRTFAQRLLGELEDHELASRWSAHGRGLGRGSRMMVSASASCSREGAAARDKLWMSWSELREKVVARVATESGNINFASGTKHCFNCGKLDCAKGSRKCSLLGKCGVKQCPCVRGNPCPIDKPVLPKREQIECGQPGRPIDEGLYKKIQEKHAKKRGNVAAVAEPPAAAAPAAPAGSVTTCVESPRVRNVGGLVCCVIQRGVSGLDATAAPFHPPVRSPTTVLRPAEAAAEFQRRIEAVPGVEGVKLQSVTEEQCVEMRERIEEERREIERAQAEQARRQREIEELQLRLQAVERERAEAAMHDVLPGVATNGIVCALSMRPPEQCKDALAIEMLLDTGADCCLTVTDGADQYASVVDNGGNAIEGLGALTTSHAMHEYYMALPGCDRAYQMRAHHMASKTMSGVSVNVMSHSRLREITGAVIRYEPELLVMPEAGGTACIEPRQRVYWVRVVIAKDPMAAVAAARLCSSTIMTMRARIGDQRHLMAARYSLDASGLVKLADAVNGIDVKVVPKEVAILINNDEALRRSRHRRASAGRHVPARYLVVRAPGEEFQCDDVPASVQCMITGAWLTFEATCVATGFGYGCPSSKHSEDDWGDFFESIIIAEAALRHTVKVFKVDSTRGPGGEHARARLEKRLHVKIEVAAGDDHEFVGARESITDPITRRTEAAMLRAKSAVPPAPDAMAIKCRLYQIAILNDVPRTDERMSRRQHHTGVVPDAKARPKPLFWTRCSVIAIGQQRGVKGLMDDARSSHERTGRVIGDGGQYMELYACDTHRVITRKPADLDPLDEHVLLQASVTAGGAVQDVEIQCTLEQRAPLQLATAPTREPSVPKPIVQYVVPGGKLPELQQLVQVLWQDASGDAWRWHDAKVIAINGAEHCLEYVAWEGEGKQLWHDLARDHATAKHPWRYVKVKVQTQQDEALQEVEQAATDVGEHVPVARTRATKQLQAPLPEVGGAKQGGPQTRARTRAHVKAVVDMIDSVVGDITERDILKAGLVWDATVKQAFGDASEQYEVFERGSLTKARVALYEASRDELERQDVLCDHVSACIAKVAGHGPDVQVASESGDMLLLSTPKSDAQVLSAPDSAEWLLEEHSAFYDAILPMPGNMIVGESEVPAGVPIERFVTVRKYKVVNGKLKRRKVRHSLDEATSNRKATADEREAKAMYATYTMPVGEMEANIFLASVEKHHLLALIDWTDAYGMGNNTHRNGENAPRYVRPPPLLDVRTETGEPGVLRLVSSLWGEGPAGNDFEVARDDDMAACAWPPMLDVPASFYNGDDRAVVIMDDLMLRVSDWSVVEQLAESLSARCVARGGKPVTVKRNPEKWGGMLLARDPERITLTSYMEDHIAASTAFWIPELVKTDIVPNDIPQGTKLRKVLDDLKRASERAARPCKMTKQVMSLVGDLKWMTRRVVRIVKHVHMLAMVANAPAEPKLALLAAKGVLAVAYVTRREGFTWGGALGESKIVGTLKGTVSSRKGSTIKRIDGGIKKAAPVAMEGASDSTWNRLDVEAVARADDNISADVYTHAITMNGALVSLELKKAHVVTGCSGELEGLALLKLSDKVIWARRVAAAYGVRMDAPTLLMCDAEAALRTAAGRQASARLKHALRRAAIVIQRVRSADVELAHVPDAANVVDMFTKWTTPEKVERSLAYLTGALARAVYLDQSASVTSVAVAALSEMLTALDVVAALSARD